MLASKNALLLGLAIWLSASLYGQSQPIFEAQFEQNEAIKADRRIAIQGSHRLVEIEGKVGYQSLDRETVCQITTDAHIRTKGSMNLWLAPLENSGILHGHAAMKADHEHHHFFNFVSDHLPVSDWDSSTFHWFWSSFWHPQMIAKYMPGRPRPDFGKPVFVQLEHMPFHKNTWYQFTLTWDFEANRMNLYVNGIHAGASNYEMRPATEPNPVLYLGNPIMAFNKLEIYDTELSEAEIAATYAQEAQGLSHAANQELHSLFTVQPAKALDWNGNEPWELSYENSFTQAGDLEGWVQEGSMEEGYHLLEKRITPEGLLLQTPEVIHHESRVYLWSPVSFEGDIALEFEFKAELPTGLALVVLNASGMQREDMIEDMPPRTTGAMSTIVYANIRNYHWEYFRNVYDVRDDLSAQVLVKNPWLHPLGMTTIPKIQTDQWYKLQMIKEGERIRCAIDGNLVLEVFDHHNTNSGSDLNYGRIGLRQMFQTRMRYRNMKVWTKNEEVKTVFIQEGK